MHYTVEMGELGDRHIEAKLAHHARLAKSSRAWTALDGQPTDRSEIDVEPPLTVAVVGETQQHLRVVSDYDEARIALYVPRAAFTPTITVATELLDPEGHGGDGTHGVWLAPGSEILPPVGTAALREVAIRDKDLKIAGMVSEAALGLVWKGPVPPDVPGNSSGSAPYLETTATIHAAASDRSRVLGMVVEMPSVTVLADTGKWAEVELRRGGLHLRGFVHSRDITTDRSGLIGHGSGTGSGYGISDTDHIPVPAGACLYDHEGGLVIGVNLADKVRYGYRRPRDPTIGEFSRVYVGTRHWGTVSAAIKWLDGKVELCTEK